MLPRSPIQMKRNSGGGGGSEKEGGAAEQRSGGARVGFRRWGGVGCGLAACLRAGFWEVTCASTASIQIFIFVILYLEKS